MSTQCVDAQSKHTSMNNTQMLPWLSEFINTYQKLDKTNLSLLNNIYHQDVMFQDPIHQVEGLGNLNQYFQHLYSNLITCEFVIDEVVAGEESSSAAIYWTMSYQHQKLNGGKTVYVQGNSLLKMADDKVIYHRDYLDLGSMLYEQIPVLGKFIKLIKRKAAQ